MEKQVIKKVTTVSFLSAAALTWLVVDVLFRASAGAFGLMQKLYSNNTLSHGVPLLAALLMFAYLQFNSRALQWAENVILEVSKVVWPSHKDVSGMTIVVVIMVMLAAGILFVFDNLARFALELLDKVLI
jgi:preprotein translocase SecE subunit